MKLLVVEDYTPIRKAVEATLRESGYAVDCGNDGLEGYSAAGNHSGLGLSLCVDTLKLLNGRLQLELPQKDRFRATVFLSSGI